VKPYKLSCHCGRIRLEVSAELDEVFECNCSICCRSGFLHWYVEPKEVKLLTERQQLSTYVWRSVTGGQHFCPTCGIAVIRTSTQYPPPVSVNARCIEDFDIATLTIQQFDGKHLVP
jgi:hypothetical protein